MTHPLKHRIAMVTGATAGIGEAIARDLARHGAYLVLNGRRADKLEALRRELGGEDAVCVAGDAADDAVIARMIDAARHKLGPKDRGACLVVVNAGRGLKGSALDSDPAQWDEVIRTNILGAAKLIRAAGHAMLEEIERETGASVTKPADASNGPTTWGPRVLSRPRDIVVMGSTVGRHISPFSSMYGSSKFAVHGLAESTRRELGPKGVRVSLIEPGFVASEVQGVAGYDPAWFEGVKQRIGPVLSPDDVARSVSFVCSQPAGVHVSDVLIRPTRQDYP